MPAKVITSHSLNDPENPPNEAEAKVAEALMGLGDGYVIRWGFYTSDETGHQQGEGDFLVLGPDGNVLHLEVKGGRCEYDPNTGRWDTADGQSPIIQRDRVWSQVLGMLKRYAKKSGGCDPLVIRLVCLPDVEIPRDIPSYQGMPREALIDQGDLADIAGLWGRIFNQRWANVEARRAVFLGVFAAFLGTGVSRYELSIMESAIDRHTAAHFHLVDALAQNHQFLFRGGPGTGKTWFALELAFRWAREGKRVLMLCFNLHLADELAALVSLKPGIPREQILVLSYEGLAKWLYEQVGEEFPVVDPQDREAAKRFYESEMPAKLRQIVGFLSGDQKFDALVVDEAQDHNTRFHPDVGAPEEAPGWWELYAGLLQDGANAPVALFYDKFQRHHGRNPSDFDAERLIRLFPNLVRVRLKQTMRYTRQILDFLRARAHAEIDELLLDMDMHSSLADGPEPQVEMAGTAGQEKSAVGRIVGEWCKKGECRPDDVLILYPTSACRPAWLDAEKVNGVPLAGDGRTGIRSTSVHKAKGLEAQAVIQIGFPPVDDVFSERSPQGTAFTWFMGVSRARQMLAIVQRSDIEVEKLRTM